MPRPLLIAFLLLLGACAEPPARDVEEPPQTLWPEPPARPRYIHEASLRHETDLRPPSVEDRLRASVLGQGLKRSAFLRPYDIAARYGRLYISDLGAGLISVFDVPRRSFYRFGYRTEGKLVKPMGLALDRQSNLYVADVGAKRVQVYDFRGMHLRTIGAEDGLEQPVAVAVNERDETVYVVDKGGIDSDRHRVLVYHKQGELKAIIGKRGTGPGEFNLPTDAAVSDDGRLFVLDSGNFRVQEFDSAGEFLGQWGSVGKGLGQFARPLSISIDRQQNLYITDMFFGNFQVFNPRGELLLPIGELDQEDRAGGYRMISGITSDETGRVYVTDQLFRKVDVFRLLNSRESDELLREWAEKNE